LAISQTCASRCYLKSLENSDLDLQNPRSGYIDGGVLKDFRELRVWQKAHEMVLTSYKLTNEFPKPELFGLTSQIRRCSASVPANIAEGCGRVGNTELHRFLQIACGSVSELEYHFLLAKDLGYIAGQQYMSVQKQLLELKKMLVALTRKVGSERSRN
jgi:four helix bundle protein